MYVISFLIELNLRFKFKNLVMMFIYKLLKIF